MGSPLGPTMANVFQSFYELKWLEQCPNEFKPVFYWRYVDDIFVLLESAEHLSKFHSYLNTCHPKMSFSFEQEANGKLSFLDVEVSRQQGKFVTTVYRKPTFLGLKVRSGEHIGISSLTFGKVKPSKESAIRDHLVHCNNIPYFE